MTQLSDPHRLNARKCGQVNCGEEPALDHKTSGSTNRVAPHRDSCKYVVSTVPSRPIDSTGASSQCGLKSGASR